MRALNLKLIILNPVTYLLVLLVGFIGYQIYHAILIDRFLQQQKFKLEFLDRLLLFRLPTWKPYTQLNYAELVHAQNMARKYARTNAIWIILYVVVSIILIYSL